MDNIIKYNLYKNKNKNKFIILIFYIVLSGATEMNKD